jgi:GH18 family chitinase
MRPSSTPRLLLLAVLFISLGVGCRPAPAATPTSPPATAAPAEPASTGAPQNAFRIVGYVTDGDTSVGQIQFDKLTHINYAFIIPRADGTFGDVKNPWKLNDVVAQAHARGVKVLISVGGWGWDDEFEELAANPEARATFVSALDQFAQQYALDGIDMDWEYPGPEPSSAQNYAALMRELEAVLKPQDKLLTSAVVAAGSTGDGILSEVFETVDFLNLMAYDGPEENHASMHYAEAALDYWSGRGLPAEKTVLGVPFYSRPTEVPYRKLVRDDPAASAADQVLRHSVMEYYNGLPTIQQKTELAMQRASGIMIWALAHDTTDSTSLLSAIYQTAYGNGQP